MGSDPISLEPPVLVFGGPYSNLRALAALRQRADELGIPPSHSICTGDVVAYWYGLIGLEAGHLLLSTRRLAYDHHGAAAAMRREGHADGYARTLVTGLWSSLDILPPAERAATGHRLRQRTVRIAARAKAEAAVVSSA